MKLTLKQISEWTGAALIAPPQTGDSTASFDSSVATGYSIDTRTLQPGDLFFAIRGDRFDAHEFVAGALSTGACAAVVARDRLAEIEDPVRTRPLLAVEDPLLALQSLAAAVRQHWGGRVVGITGSAGKTTTKEAVAAVLSAQFRVLKSKGNLNNHFGLPLQVLKIEPEDQVAVIEMGMSAAGEIARLAEIAKPDWGVVTNVGTAHAENFPDGVAGIARAKSELIASLPAEGIAFLNADDPHVSRFGSAFGGRVVRFGLDATAEVRATDIEENGVSGTRFQIKAEGRRAEVRLALLGRHNVTNALAAVAVGLAAGIPLERCVTGPGGAPAAGQARRSNRVRRRPDHQ